MPPGPKKGGNFLDRYNWASLDEELQSDYNSESEG